MATFSFPSGFEGENSVVKCRKTGKIYGEITSSIQLLEQFG